MVSKHRGRKANNRLSEEVKRKALSLLKTKYQGFGPTLAHEKLVERETPTPEAVGDWIPLALVMEKPPAKQPRSLPGPDWLKRFFAAFQAFGGRDA